MKNLDLRISDKYRLVRRLGKGGSALVYLATDLKSGQDVAVKLEHQSMYPELLSSEYDFYEPLAGGTGIPQIHWCGSEADYRVMALELLGPSLEDLFNYCGRLFSLKTVLMLADQLIARFQYIHSKNIIHRDVKPENFLMGMGGKGNCVYVTDLGLAMEFVHHHSPPPTTGGTESRLFGTATFASLNGHRGTLMQSPRDDMESLGYMMLYFLKGRLPWFSLRGESKQQTLQLMMDQKANISLEELCSDVPEEFRKYMAHVRGLGYGDKPGYSRLRRMLRALFLRRGFEHDHVFDWTVLKYMESVEQGHEVSSENREGLSS